MQSYSNYRKVGLFLCVILFACLVFLIKSNLQQIVTEHKVQERRLAQEKKEQEEQEKQEREKQEIAARNKAAEEAAVSSPSPSPTPSLSVTDSPAEVNHASDSETVDNPQLIEVDVRSQLTTVHEAMSRLYQDKSPDYFLYFDANYVFKEDGRVDSMEDNRRWVTGLWDRENYSSQVETAIDGDLVINGFRVTLPIRQTIHSTTLQEGVSSEKDMIIKGFETWEWNTLRKKWQIVQMEVTSREAVTPVTPITDDTAPK